MKPKLLELQVAPKTDIEDYLETVSAADFQKDIAAFIQAFTPSETAVSTLPENSTYPREDWQYEVTNGDTQLGYWAWVCGNIERGGYVNTTI